MPDSAVEGESGMSLTKEVFTEPELLSQLFSPKDYETCEDKRVKDVFEVMSGLKKGSETAHIDTSRFFLTENRYLMRASLNPNTKARNRAMLSYRIISPGSGSESTASRLFSPPSGLRCEKVRGP